MSHEEIVEGLKRDRFAAANGIELLEVRPGYARTRVVPDPRHRNSVDLVHGGVLFTLAATAFFAAANAHGRVALGTNMTLSCLRPAPPGALEAEAQELSRSRRLSTCSVRVTGAGGALVALFQGTAYIKDDPFPPAERG